MSQRRPRQSNGSFNLMENIQYLIFGFVAIFLMIFGKKMYNSWKNGNGIFSMFAAKSGLEVEYPKKNGSTTTITDTNAKMLATRLENAMKGMGTDEDTIFEIINNKLTINDLRAITNAFGTRMYQAAAPAFMHNAMNFLSFALPKLSLVDWLKAELNEKEWNKIAPLFEKADIK